MLAMKPQTAQDKRIEALEREVNEYKLATDSRVRHSLEQGACIVKLEQEVRQLRAEKAQAATIVQELLDQVHTVSTENSDLRMTVSSLEIENEQLKTQVVHLERVSPDEMKVEQLSSANGMVQNLTTQEAKRKALIANEHIEQGDKVIAMALFDAERELARDENGNTPIGSLDRFGKRAGVKRQTVARTLHKLEGAGILTLDYGTQEITTSAKHGKRKLEVHPISFKMNDIAAHPEDWRKPDGVKKHGGFGKRKCGNCGFDDLQDIPHTRCRCCGEETVKRQLTEEEKLQNEIALASKDYQNIIKPEWVVVVPGKQQQTPDTEVVQDERVSSEQLPTTSEQLPETQVVQDERDCTPERENFLMNATVWQLIAEKDPGTWVPEDVLAYWKSQGREYIITEEERPPRPAYTPDTTRTHTRVDFATGNIVAA